MEKLQNILLGLLILILGGALGIFVVPKLIKDSSFLIIQTSHPAQVYIDNKYIGKAPIQLQPGKKRFALRLIPDDRFFGEFAEQIIIGKNTTTKILARFSPEANQASSLLSYYESIGPSEVEISVVSSPNLARLEIDEQVRGFTPVKLTPTVGKHNVEVSFDGYHPQEFEVETKEGYRSIAIVKLAKDVSYNPTPTSVPESNSLSVETLEMIEILETPTGFLRVRKDANTASAEIGQAKPGEKFVLLDKDTAPDWFEIQFTENEKGWVSKTYAKVVEENVNLSN